MSLLSYFIDSKVPKFQTNKKVVGGQNETKNDTARATIITENGKRYADFLKNALFAILLEEYILKHPE